MDLEKFSRLHLDAQEKNALYFYITDIIKNQSDPKFVVKDICEKLYELWNDKVNEIFEIEESLPKKKTPMFRRVE